MNTIDAVEPQDAGPPNLRAPSENLDRDRIEALRRLARTAIGMAADDRMRLSDQTERGEAIDLLRLANAAMDAIERLQRIR